MYMCLRGVCRVKPKIPEYTSRMKILKKPETMLVLYLMGGGICGENLKPPTQSLGGKKGAGKFKFGLFRGIRFCALFYLWLSHGFSIQEGH